jgi:hypothetical protein
MKLLTASVISVLFLWCVGVYHYTGSEWRYTETHPQNGEYSDYGQARRSGEMAYLKTIIKDNKQ